MGIGQCDYILVLASYSIPPRTWLLLTLRFHPISFPPAFDSSEDNFYLAKLSSPRCFPPNYPVFILSLRSISPLEYRIDMGRGGGEEEMKMNFGRVFVNIDNWACMANIGNRVNRLHSLIFCFQYLSFFSFFKFVVWLINNCK